MQGTGYRVQGTGFRLRQQFLIGGLAAWGLAGSMAFVRGQDKATKKPPVTPPAAAVPQKTPAELVFPVAISCRPWNGLYVSDIFINKGLQRVLLDTGLNVNAASPDAVSALDVMPGTATVRVEAFDNAHTVPEGILKALRIGNLALTDLRVALTDVFGLMSAVENTPADAPVLWLGAPFLANYQVTLNLSEKYIVLDQPTAKIPVEKGAIKVPLTVREGRVWVNVSVGKGKPFPAIVDTGTVGTLLPGNAMAALKLKPLKEIPLTRSGKPGTAVLTTLPKLSVGKAEVKDLSVVYLASGDAPEFNRSLAVLGTDFLRRYKVIINYAQKFLLLLPPAAPAQPDPNDAQN